MYSNFNFFLKLVHDKLECDIFLHVSSSYVFCSSCFKSYEIYHEPLQINCYSLRHNMVDISHTKMMNLFPVKNFGACWSSCLLPVINENELHTKLQNIFYFCQKTGCLIVVKTKLNYHSSLVKTIKLKIYYLSPPLKIIQKWSNLHS